MASIKDIITRKYTNFRGVDFTGGVVQYYRSPDAKNMWKDYKDDDCIQTRPGLKLQDAFSSISGKIYGLFFLKKNNVEHCLIHKGTKIYEWTNYPTTPATTTQKFVGMNPDYSKSFIFNNTLFIVDGINYLEYDGSNVTSVVGTIPYTSYYRNPDGSSNLDADTDTDTVFQPVNLIQPKRINRFISDGTSTNYYLDTTNLDPATTYLMEGQLINGTTVTTITENIEFTVNRTSGIVTFNTAPSEGVIVTITLSKTINNNAKMVNQCDLVAEFDNRIFLSGNPDFPNLVVHSQLDDPRYFTDTLQNTCGVDLARVKAIIPGNNVLWVIKAIEQNTSSIHYLTPTYNDSGEKCYSDVTGSITLGCISTGINFNDDVVFFSNKGLESINTSALYSEQILMHRSSMVDNKLLSETDYKNIKLAEWEGYLLCLVGSHIYLADSRQMLKTVANETEYEWYYWELPDNVEYMKEYKGTLYLSNSEGELFTLEGTKDDTTNELITTGYYPINSYWTTKKDDMDYPGYTKTTNKRGNVVNIKKMSNTEIELYTIVDGISKYKNTYSDSKGYFPFRIKDKKFKEIQIKISSNKPFGLFSCTLESFVAGYIKR